jgi:Amidohydrolase family
MIDNLTAIQEEKAKPFYKSINQKLSETIPAKLAITNVSVFDPQKAVAVSKMTVFIENGVVTACQKSSGIKPTKDYAIINGEGKMLLPGLWDTHSHYFKESGIGYLSGGITHVRDMGNMPEVLLMQKNIRSHDLTGPDISYTSGFLDKDDEYHGPVGKIVSSLQEGINAIHSFHDSHYDQIKLYSSIDTAWVKPLCDEAHKLGMRVAGHIPSFMHAADAVKKGYNEITHLNMVFLNFLPDTIDTRKNRFKPVGRGAWKLDLKSREVNDFISLLKQKRIVVEPTLNIFEEMFFIPPGDTIERIKPVVRWMPVAARQDLAKKSFVDDTAYIDEYRRSYLNMLGMVSLLHKNGITMLAGTDGGNQLALHRELELMVKAGIPANEVLRIATYNPVKVFGLTNKYGSIEKGRIADMILVDGNPVKEISDIRKVKMVITNNLIYYPKKLYDYIGWSYYY